MKISELLKGKRYLIEPQRGELIEVSIIETAENAVKVKYIGGNVAWIKEENIKHHTLFADLGFAPN
jgi:hypothetical protein